MTKRFYGRQPKEMIERELARETRIVNAEARISAYEALLCRWNDMLITWQTENAAACPICGNPDWFNGKHGDGCLVLDTRNALAADADGIVFLLGGWARAQMGGEE